MRKYIKTLIILLLVIFPTSAFAEGGFSYSTSNVTIEVGKSKTVNLTATNAVGDVSISSSNPGIASVNSSSWDFKPDEKETANFSLVINGVSVGNTTIKLNVDCATYDSDEYNYVKEINVTVVAPVIEPVIQKEEPPVVEEKKPDVPVVQSTPTPITPEPQQQVEKNETNNTKKENVTLKTETNTKKTTSTTVTTTIPVEVTSIEEVTEPVTEEITTEVVKINNKKPLLKYLKVAGYKIDFDKNKLNYKIMIDSKVNELYVYAKGENEDYSIKGTDIINIESIRVLKIKVTDIDGNENVYNIELVRKNNTKEKIIIIVMMLLLDCIGISGYMFIKAKKNAGILTKL